MWQSLLICVCQSLILRQFLCSILRITIDKESPNGGPYCPQGLNILISCLYLKFSMGLERQLSAWEFSMHLQEALVGLPALAWYLTTACNSKFKRSDPLFWSYRHQEITPRAYTPESKTITYVKYNKLILKTLKMSKGLFYFYLCECVCSCVSLCVYACAYGSPGRPPQKMVLDCLELELKEAVSH